jgi:hypothetical protein
LSGLLQQYSENSKFSLEWSEEVGKVKIEGLPEGDALINIPLHEFKAKDANNQVDQRLQERQKEYPRQKMLQITKVSEGVYQFGSFYKA